MSKLSCRWTCPLQKLALALHNMIKEVFTMNIRPLHDRVVIKRLEEDSTSPGGIVIPDSAAEKPSRGKVLAVGNGKKLDDGKTLPLDVKVGDLVLFGTYSGTEFTLDNEKLLIMREDDISAVLKSK